MREWDISEGKEMGFELLQKKLKWPDRKLIFQPSGTGVKINHTIIEEKLKRNLDNTDFNVGVLTVDPNSEDTSAVISIVCEFKKPVTSEQTELLHKTAWNLSKSPMLIIVEPHQIRVWSCWEKPKDSQNKTDTSDIKELYFDSNSPLVLDETLHGLHYIELISGNTFKNFESNFNYRNGAEYLLLQNLKTVRNILTEEYKLERNTAHGLLARIIFIQFLFDKKDSQGNSALNQKKLNKLYRENSRLKLLSKSYKNLSEILENYEDTYRLFQYLNHKFNGDLFPGKAKTKKERETEWRQEKELVKPEHLKLLADFVSGKNELFKKHKQPLLWRLYNFDAVPLEFISNIYEEFVNNSDIKGTATVYTPSFLVDFILDGILPWNSPEWNLKVLDPSCGSGIFLVKVYQRLIHRWKLANNKNPNPAILRNLLMNNILGVDKHEESVRVASFSLYLAMLDEIEPRDYWNRDEKVKFPILRNIRIIHSDFFAEDKEGFRTKEDEKSFDLIIGNAPWGEKSKTDLAVIWAWDYKWSIKDGDIGPLFLAKSAFLLKQTGKVSMIQPAGTLLFDQVGTAVKFRKKFFKSFTVSEIVNFSPVRDTLFKGAKSPACCITFSAEENKNKQLIYINVKPYKTMEDEYRLLIDPYNIHQLEQNEIIEYPTVLISLIWGQRRDYEIINRIKQKGKSISQLVKQGRLKTRLGVMYRDELEIISSFSDKTEKTVKDFKNSRAKSKKKRILIVKIYDKWEIYGYTPKGEFKKIILDSDSALMLDLNKPEVQRDKKKILEESKIKLGYKSAEKPNIHYEEGIIRAKIFKENEFPEDSFISINADSFPINNDPWIYSKNAKDYTIFDYPHIFIKLGWEKERFQSRLISSSKKEKVICNDNFMVVHSFNKDLELLRKIVVTINSIYCQYYLLLNSRFAYYRDAIKNKDFESLPLPEKLSPFSENISSYDQIDAVVKDSFNFKDSEKVLIDDLFNYTLPDFKGDSNSPGRQRTNRNNSEIKDYCDYLIKVLKGGFGKDKKISVTIFNEEGNIKFPYRLVALHLDFEFSDRKYREQKLSQENLWNELHKLSNKQDSNGGIFYNRVSIIYDTMKIDGRKIPTVYIVKPDQKKYWLRSIGLRDGDSIFADIMSWENKDA